MSTNTDTIISTDFAKLEKALAKAERGALDVWVQAYNAWYVESTVNEVSVSAFAKAWHEAFPTRSASTVRINIGYCKKAEEMGYDLSTFVSLDHVVEVVNPNQASAEHKVVKPLDKVAKELDKMSKKELLRLQAMIQARLAD